MIGKVLGGRYELLEEIGKGGMAYVYKARCVLLNRIVAVKVLRDDLGGDEEFLNRFNAEAQAAASLDHQNIVSIFDVGVDDDRHYITMEYVDGRTLKEYITQKGPLPYKEALDIASQICDAIEAAHNKNIVHRDIKPHNILITDDGKIKVADFGIARFGTGKTLSNGNDILGSVHYISPEQAKGISVDNRSDIYSLGVVLYEMLSGKLPFDSDNPVSVAMMQIEESPCDIINSVPNLPLSCQHMVFKAMSKDPDLRYQTAAEFKSDIVSIYRDPGVVIDKRFLYENLNPEPESGKIADAPKPQAKPHIKVIMVALSVITSFVIVFGGYLIWRMNPVEVVSGIFSAKPKQVEVPLIVGKSLSEARKICDEYGITVIIDDETIDDTKPEDTVIYQSPSANGKMNVDGIINVIISVKSQQFELKDYIGQDYRAVQEKLENANLQISIIFEESEDEEDVIIDQSPKSGTVLDSGDRVTLYVSGGKGDVDKMEGLMEVPMVEGKTFAEAKKALETSGLKISSVAGTLNPKDDDLVIGQSITAGSHVKDGTSISLTVEITFVEDEAGTGDTSTAENDGSASPSHANNPSNSGEGDE